MFRVSMASNKGLTAGSSQGGGPSWPREPYALGDGATANPNIEGGVSVSIFEGHH